MPNFRPFLLGKQSHDRLIFCLLPYPRCGTGEIFERSPCAFSLHSVSDPSMNEPNIGSPSTGLRYVASTKIGGTWDGWESDVDVGQLCPHVVEITLLFFVFSLANASHQDYTTNRSKD